MKMKKGRFFLLTTVMLVIGTLILCGCGNKNSDVKEAKDLYWVKDLPFGDTTVNVQWGDIFFDGDPEDGFQYDLAITTCVMSQATEASKGEAKNVFKKLGFENIKNADNYGQALEVDSPAWTMGAQTLSDGRRLVALAIRGTSDVGDVGTDIASISNGFVPSGENTANELWEYLKEEYAADEGVEEVVLLITGHSLGGATANRVAQEVAAVSEMDVYVYTFAAARCDVDDGNYDNVFNLVNGNDYVPKIPYNMGRCGTDKTFNLEGDTDSEIYAALTGGQSLPQGKVNLVGLISDIKNPYGQHNLRSYLTGLLSTNYKKNDVDWRPYLGEFPEQEETETTEETTEETTAETESTESGLDGTWVDTETGLNEFIFSGNEVSMNAFGVEGKGTFEISGDEMVITYTLWYGDTQLGDKEYTWPVDWELDGDYLYIRGDEFVRQ